MCVLLEGEHVGVLRGDAEQSLGVRCVQRRLSGLGGKALPQHLSGGSTRVKSHDPPRLRVTSSTLSPSKDFSRVLVNFAWRKTRYMPLQMKVTVF